MGNNSEVQYSGFWVRVLAVFIDGLILSIPLAIVERLLGEDSWISIILIVILWWFYSAKMLSSSWKATVGKKVLGLEVLNVEYEQLTLNEASVRFLYSFISYSFILPIFMMFFNDKKQTFHDYFAKTVVIDKVAIVMKNRQDTGNSVMDKKEKIGFTRLIRGIGIFIIVVASAYSIYYFTMFAFVFGSIASHKSQEYQTTLEKYHTIDDKNDSRIVFYVKELEKSGDKYLNATKVPEIFKARVKRKLALNCIGYFLREHNDDTWLDQVQAVDKNQLNAYAQNTTIYDKRKSDKNWNFYNNYYFNELYEAQAKIASSFEKEVSQQSCDKLQTAEEMFNRFLLPYIYTKENTLRRYIEDEKTAPIFGTLNKSFHQKSIKDKKQLLEILYEGFPKIKQMKKIEKQQVLEKEAEQKRQRIQKERENAIVYQKKMAKRKLERNIMKEENKKLLLLLSKQLFQKNKNLQEIDKLLKKVSNIDLWIKDKNQGSLLYQAIKLNNFNASKILLENGASPTKTTTLLHQALFSDTDLKLFKLFLEYYLEPKYHRNIQSVLIRAIEKHIEYAKIKIILEYSSRMDVPLKSYEYIMNLAIGTCTPPQTIKLLLSYGVKLNSKYKPLSLIHNNSYKCSNKKEILELFESDKKQKVHSKIKLLEVKNK